MIMLNQHLNVENAELEIFSIGVNPKMSNNLPKFLD